MIQELLRIKDGGSIINTNIRILLVAILLAFMPPANAYIEKISQTNTPDAVTYDATNPWFNQSFTTPNPSNTSQFEIKNITVGGRNLGGSTTVTIKITNNTYTSQAITGTVNGVDAWHTIEFSQGAVILEKNKQYYFNLTRQIGSTFEFYSDKNGNPYSGGRAFDYAGSYNANSDMAFIINLSSHDTVGSWTLNQGSGNYANDSSGFNNNGTIYTISSGSASWSTNLNNGSVNSTGLRLDGISGNITVPTNSSLNFSTYPFSFGLWLLPYPNNEPAASGRIISKTDGASGYEALLVTATNKLYFLTTPTGTIQESNTAIPNAAFSYLYFEFNGTHKNIYINNVLDKSTAWTASSVDVANNLTIGQYSADNLRHLNGVLDEIKIYNYALNQSERTTEYQRFHPVPAYPVGNISLVASSFSNTITVPFSWHDTVYSTDYIDVATDSGFTSIVASQISSSDSATITLPTNVTYYWRVRQYDPGTGLYGRTSATQIFQALPTQGYLNVVVKDELTFAVVSNYTATVYDGEVKSKSTTNGVVNFTNADVGVGQFELVIVPNSTYAERAIIVNSPGNYTVYLPPTSRTVDFVAFYLLDYTGRFPFSTSNLTITKGINITHSAFFDSDAKVAANLIRGEIYTITVYNPSTNDLQQWGNYGSTGTGSVQVVIMDLGVNKTIFQPYVQQINASNQSIDLSWLDRGGVLTYLNISIYKDNASTLVYTLNTTSSQGTVSYIITDLNATYITFMNATTTNGLVQTTNIFSSSHSTALIRNWSYGSLTIPSWVKNAVAIVILFMLAGSFGAIHRGEGAIVSSIYAMFMWYYDMLSISGAIAALFTALVVFSILYHLETKRRQGGYY